MPNFPYERYLSEVLIDELTLQNRIAELGQQLTQDYNDLDNIILVCILKGGVAFLTDLMRHFHIPHSIDFLAVSSYGLGARESKGQVRIVMDLNTVITGKHVLIVEDIIDSGHTLSFVMDMLQARQPASIKLCTLLDKPSRREVDIKADYIGFQIPNKFVFGYGLDLDEKFRNLCFIGVVNESALNSDAQ